MGLTCGGLSPPDMILLGVGGSGRSPVSPPTPGSGVWEGLGNVKNGNCSKGSFETSSGGLGAGVPISPNGSRWELHFDAIY